MNPHAPAQPKAYTPIMGRFGRETASEVDVMLTASAESGTCPMAVAVLAQRNGTDWPLTIEQALWLGTEMVNDSDRVAEACGGGLGRAFERAGERLSTQARAVLARAVQPGA